MDELEPIPASGREIAAEFVQNCWIPLDLEWASR